VIPTNTFELIFLDDCEDLRLAMIGLLEARLSIKCLSLGSLKDLLDQGPLALQAKAAILDLDLGPRQPTGLDAYYWLKESGFKGDVHVLTGHGHHHPLVRIAEKEGARIWQKPLLARDLVAALKPKFQSTELSFSCLLQ
jgi:FixJ family two-component response regulator